MPLASELAPRLQQALLVDWDAPELQGAEFVGPDGSARRRLTEIANPRADAALTWSVFRVLGRFPAAVWLPHLLGAEPDPARWEPATLDWWVPVAPPAGRLLWLLDRLDDLLADDRLPAAGRARIKRVAANLDRWRAQIAAGADRGDGILEGAYEADAVIQTPAALVVVTGRYQRDVESSTAWDPARDAICRGLDAALDRAGPDREPWYLLVTDDYHHESSADRLVYNDYRGAPETKTMAYERLMPRYESDAAFLAERLPHRTPEERSRLAGHIRWLSWADLTDAVLDYSAALSAEHRLLLRKMVDYLRDKRLLFKGTR